MRDIIDIILFSAEGAFLQVGVFVGIVLLLFGYINYKTKGRFIATLENAKGIQPIIGALLGITPGCGGAIFVMPLYIKGKVTFGTIIATLIATMGDAAFVLITSDFRAYIIVSVVSLVVGIITGYIVDALHITGGIKAFEKTDEDEQLSHIEKVHDSLDVLAHIGHEEGDEVDRMLHHTGKKISKRIEYFTHTVGYLLFWIIIVIGLVLGVILLTQVDVNTELLIPNLGMIVGVIGTLSAIAYTIINKNFIANDDHEEEEQKLYSLKETLIHNAEETAFVILWVFVAYLIYELTVHFIGGEQMLMSFMLASGVMSVIIGALIGLIPGCGPQIIFVSLYSKGMLPIAALIANAISQDGDALFPLIIMHKRSSLIATLVTTIPALLVGLLIYFLVGFM
jgi:hypothetical protein